VPCLDPDLAPVPACSCAQISIRGEPEPGFSLKLVPTFVKAPFEHEKFSAAFQIKFDRGTWSPNAPALRSRFCPQTIPHPCGLGLLAA
jgi:hypothetical protein